MKVEFVKKVSEHETTFGVVIDNVFTKLPYWLEVQIADEMYPNGNLEDKKQILEGEIERLEHYLKTRVGLKDNLLNEIKALQAQLK